MPPLYFINAFWGEAFTEYFIDLALRSLLFPGNLPSVTNKAESRLVICTTAVDRARLERHPGFQHAAALIPVEWLMMDAPTSHRQKYLAMSAGHRRASELAFRRGAVGVFVTPDAMFSDGSVRYIEAKLRAGYTCLLAPALRYGFEPFMDGLRRQPGYVQGDPMSSVALDGRGLAQLALAALHPETQRYDWDSPYFSHFPVSVFLWNRNRDGMLLHTFSWSPCLLDYRALAVHDSSTFERWTLDGDYVFRNFGCSRAVQVASDSDDLLYIGFTPMNERSETLLRNHHRAAALGMLANSALMDPLKRDLFSVPVRIHAAPIDEAWHDLERRSDEILRAAVKRPVAAEAVAVGVARLIEDYGRYGVRALVPEPVRRVVRSLRTARCT